MDTTDYKEEFLKLLKSSAKNEVDEHIYEYVPNKPVKLHMGFESSIMYDKNDLRTSMVTTMFKNTVAYDTELLGNILYKSSDDKKKSEKEFLTYKFLYSIFNDISVIYFHDFNSSNDSLICYFKLKKMDKYIFELSSKQGSNSMISFDSLTTNGSFKQNNYVTLYCFSQNCYSFYLGEKQILKTLDIKNPEFSVTKQIKNSISLLSAMPGGQFRKSKYEIEHINKECVEYYDDEIKEKSDTILELIKTRNKGMMLFHGEKGCGKTTFIKYIISNSEKNFYYVNGEAAASFSSSSFLEFIALNSKNSVFIFEDMEHLIVSRENKTNSVISDILNASDGILSDILSPIFIFTFNTKIENIDSAFLRPGRLILEQEFKKLSYEESKKVAKKIKVKLDEEKEYSLAEIFEKQNLPKNTSVRSKKFNTESSSVIKGFVN